MLIEHPEFQRLLSDLKLACKVKPEKGEQVEDINRIDDI